MSEHGHYALRQMRLLIAPILMAASSLPGQVVGIDRIPQRLDTGKPIRALKAASEARLRERATERYDPIFRKYTKRYFGIGGDWRRFKAQGMAESDLNPEAKSWVGARGIMQLMPTTYRMIASRRPDMQAINDPESNIAAGIMHNRYLWKLWQKDVPEAQLWNFMYASYNAGEGTIGRARRTALDAKLDHGHWGNIETVAPRVQRWRYRETLGYVKKIEKNYTFLEARQSARPGRK